MVAELRAKTDAPMMECKKALTEADGDAVERARRSCASKARQQGGKAAAARHRRGRVARPSRAPTGALVEVNCETDFRPKNDLLRFAKAAAELVGQSNLADIAALSALPYAQDGFGPTLEDAQGPDRQDRREHVDPPLARDRRRRQPGALPPRHAHRRGRSSHGDATAAKDVAMHVAAMKPAALSSPGRGAGRAGRRRKRKIASEKAAESGKPADIVAKMVEGLGRRSSSRRCLLDQVFVKATASRPSARCSRAPAPS